MLPAQPRRRLRRRRECCSPWASSPRCSRRSASGKGQVMDAAMTDGAALLSSMMYGLRGTWTLEQRARQRTCSTGARTSTTRTSAPTASTSRSAPSSRNSTPPFARAVASPVAVFDAQTRSGAMAASEGSLAAIFLTRARASGARTSMGRHVRRAGARLGRGTSTRTTLREGPSSRSMASPSPPRHLASAARPHPFQNPRASPATTRARSCRHGACRKASSAGYCLPARTSSCPATRRHSEFRPDTDIGSERRSRHESPGIGQRRHQVGDARCGAGKPPVWKKVPPR